MKSSKQNADNSQNNSNTINIVKSIKFQMIDPTIYQILCLRNKQFQDDLNL